LFDYFDVPSAFGIPIILSIGSFCAIKYYKTFKHWSGVFLLFILTALALASHFQVSDAVVGLGAIALISAFIFNETRA
jgi:hypothetical protein